MGSDDDDVLDDEYQLDLTPPEVEESILVKKPSPQKASPKKIFKSLLPAVAFSTHEDAKKFLKQNRMKYEYVKFGIILRNILIFLDNSFYH